jgi:hypothetical protein
MAQSKSSLTNENSSLGSASLESSSVESSSVESSLPSAPPIARRKIVDPLGEIEALAKKMCAEAEGGDIAHWEKYWSAAEGHMVAGKSSGIDSGRKKVGKAESDVAPEFSGFLRAGQSQQAGQARLLPLLARAMQRPLNDHEACCLGYVLQHNVFTFVDGEALPPQSIEQCSSLLADLAGEYDKDFIQSQGTANISLISREQKQRYWTRRLAGIREQDSPLTYAHQNTIMRVRDSIAGSPEIKSLEFRAEAITENKE